MRYLFWINEGASDYGNLVLCAVDAVKRAGNAVHVVIGRSGRIASDGYEMLDAGKRDFRSIMKSIDQSDITWLPPKNSQGYAAVRASEGIESSIAKTIIQYFKPDYVVTKNGRIKDVKHIRSIKNALANDAKFVSIDRLSSGKYDHLKHKTDKDVALSIARSSRLVGRAKNLVVADQGLASAVVTDGRMMADRCAELVENSAIRDVSAGSISGRVESPEMNSILFGDTLSIRGWVDCGSLNIRSIVARVNGKEFKFSAFFVRGDIVEKTKNHNSMGFDFSIPMEGFGCRVKIALYIVDGDGNERAWKNMFVWANDTIVKTPSLPVISGDFKVVGDKGMSYVSGSVSAESMQVSHIEMIQLGKVLCRYDVSENPDGDSEFHCELDSAYDSSLPIHAWIHTRGRGCVYWMSSNGDRVNDFELSCECGCVVSPSDGGVVLNASAAAQVAGTNVYVCGRMQGAPRSLSRSVSVDVAAEGLGNRIVVELLSADGKYSSINLWRHVPVNGYPEKGPCISVPNSSAIPGASKVSNRIVVIRKEPAPTDELYVIGPLAGLAGNGIVDVVCVNTNDEIESGIARTDILMPGDNVIVSRYVTKPWIDKITQMKCVLGKVVYLLDDDLANAADSIWLPGGYRKKIMDVAGGEFQTMINLCDKFVVTCKYLHRHYRSQKTDLLEPPFLRERSDMSHWNDIDEFVIWYDGTIVHRDDLDAIAPALKVIHNKYRNVKIRMLMGRYAPRILKDLPRVDVLYPMTWEDYKKYSVTNIAHIGLAPILNVPYNKGKSFVKMFDIAAMGAVGVYSNTFPYSEVVSHGKDGFLINNDPSLWVDAISWVIDHPDEARAMAIESQLKCKDVGAMGRLTNYWSELFGLTKT